MYDHLENKSKIVHNLDLTKVKNKGALKAICFSKETFIFKIQNFGIKEYSNTGFITLFTKNSLHPKLNHIFKIFDDIENQVLDVIFENRYKWCNGMNIPRYHFEEAYHQPIKIKNNETNICCHFDSCIELADLEKIFSAKKIVTFVLEYQGFELSESDIFPLFKLSEIIYKEIIYTNVLTENSSSDEVTELSEMSCYQSNIGKKDYDFDTSKDQHFFMSDSKHIYKETGTDEKINSNVSSRLDPNHTNTETSFNDNFIASQNAQETKQSSLSISEKGSYCFDKSLNYITEYVVDKNNLNCESSNQLQDSNSCFQTSSLDEYISTELDSKIENILLTKDKHNINNLKGNNIEKTIFDEIEQILLNEADIDHKNDKVKSLVKRDTCEREKKKEKKKDYTNSNTNTNKENSKSVSNKSFSKYVPANYVSNVEFLKIKKSQDLKNMYLETINNGYESQFEKACKIRIKK
jgi:hypothetical protein